MIIVEKKTAEILVKELNANSPKAGFEKFLHEYADHFKKTNPHLFKFIKGYRTLVDDDVFMNFCMVLYELFYQQAKEGSQIAELFIDEETVKNAFMDIKMALYGNDEDAFVKATQPKIYDVLEHLVKTQKYVMSFLGSFTEKLELQQIPEEEKEQHLFSLSLATMVVSQFYIPLIQ